jgi:hypothetical protein
MAAGYAGVYLLGHTRFALYALMALMGVGWAAIVSLPFLDHVAARRPVPHRLYMGVFNLVDRCCRSSS